MWDMWDALEKEYKKNINCHIEFIFIQPSSSSLPYPDWYIEYLTSQSSQMCDVICNPLLDTRINQMTRRIFEHSMLCGVNVSGPHGPEVIISDSLRENKIFIPFTRIDYVTIYLGQYSLIGANEIS
jgi:hypothetical protein